MLQQSPVIDGHNDLPWAMRHLVDYDMDRYDLTQRQSKTHTDFPRLVEGGVRGQFWSVFVPSSLAGEKAVSATLEQIDFVHRMVARYPEQLALAASVKEVRAALATGRIASLMGAEGGHSIDSSLGVLRALYFLGVRYLTLTHNDNVPWADSATDVEVLGGLSEFGRDVVREMNRLGMLVDLSHVSAGTMRDALSTSKAPVIFSHSSARAVCDHVRNVPDDVLTTLAGNGGVCMVTFVPSFVSERCRLWEDEIKAEMDTRGENRRDWGQLMAALNRRAAVETPPIATVADVADHVEHVRTVAGIEHVGLGGDYDGCDVLPQGLEDVSGYPLLLEVLAERGWSDFDLAALTGGNVLRVLADAEREATF
jgi:membrane dipeptidase